MADSLEELESAYILAEADLSIARAKHDGIKKKRHEIKEQVKEVKESFAEKVYELQKQIRVLQEESLKATEDLDKEYRDLYSPEWDAQRDLNKAQRELDALQLKIDQARRAQLQAAEFATLENRWDLMTAGAPWREWAKDHQISGGKKMVYEGRLVLGDTMGLGKTLTAFIACDMIEAATKEASPENPIKFGAD